MKESRINFTIESNTNQVSVPLKFAWSPESETTFAPVTNDELESLMVKTIKDSIRDVVNDDNKMDSLVRLFIRKMSDVK